MKYSFAKFRDFQGGGYGVAILYKPTLTLLEEKILRYADPTKPGPSTCGDPQPRDFCQGALALRLLLPTGNVFWFVTTHLGLGMQAEEIPQLLDFVRTLSSTAPVVITGDFNVIPSFTEMASLYKEWSEGWRDCGDGSEGWTFSSAKPYEKIDYVFVAPAPSPVFPPPKCLSATIPASQSSDHFPLVVRYAVA